MNTFLNELEDNLNYTLTENGAIAHKGTNDAGYDLFAFGGAYRNVCDDKIEDLFSKAYDEDPEKALRTLFYLRDCRGGQGERRFFRVAYRWLCVTNPGIAAKNLMNIAYFGRWDDLWQATLYTPVMDTALRVIATQLMLDLDCRENGISLCAKWAPSINCSNETRRLVADRLCWIMGWRHSTYRKMLSKLRGRINVLERLMSQGRWDEIEFDKIPSRAGMKYKNAFARHEITKAKYEAFAKDETKKVNADVLYPYDVVRQVLQDGGVSCYGGRIHRSKQLSETDRLMFQKYWDNLPDYLDGAEESMIAVVDTSGSMTSSWNQNVRPIDVAISLGLYLAERNKGNFANKYISFASRPQLIDTKGRDIVEKVEKIYKTNLVDNTNLTAVFDLILKTALNSDTSDMPKRVVIISDMNIDQGVDDVRDYYNWMYGETATGIKNPHGKLLTTMEKIHKKFAAAGVEMPKLVYWNVNCLNGKPVVLDHSPDVTCVSGCNPVIFKQIMEGVVKTLDPSNRITAASCT